MNKVEKVQVLNALANLQNSLYLSALYFDRVIESAIKSRSPDGKKIIKEASKRHNELNRITMNNIEWLLSLLDEAERKNIGRLTSWEMTSFGIPGLLKFEKKK